MKEIESLFLAFRSHRKADSRNSKWAVIDAKEFLELYHMAYPMHSDESALQYLRDIITQTAEKDGIVALKLKILEPLKQKSYDYFRLSSPYQRCEEILKAWLTHWTYKERQEFLRFLYHRYSYQRKGDHTAIIEIVHSIFLKIHHYSQDMLEPGLLRKVAANKDIYTTNAYDHFDETTDARMQELSTGLYNLMLEPANQDVDALYHTVVNKYKLSDNDRLILDIALEVCKEENSGKNRKEKFRRFQKTFKSRLRDRINAKANTLNQAIKRLRDKIIEEQNYIELNSLMLYTSRESFSYSTKTIPQNDLKNFKLLINILAWRVEMAEWIKKAPKINP